MPAVSVNDIRVQAHALKEQHGTVPSLVEVARALDMSSDACRIIINNSRKTNPVTWEELGIQPGILSRERQLLGDQLHQLKTDRARAFAVSKVLDLCLAGKLSSDQTRLLTYAIHTGASLYQQLDVPYAEHYHKEPHLVSNQLHSRKRAGRHFPGVLEKLENAIMTNASVSDGPPTLVRYREFVVNCVHFFRACAANGLFTAFVESGSGNAEAARLIGPRLEQILSSEWPKTLTISPSHANLICNLTHDKLSGEFTTLRAFAAAHQIDQSGIHSAFKTRGEYPGIGDRLLLGSDRISADKHDALEEALHALRHERKMTPVQAGLVMGALEAVLQAQDVMTVNQRRSVRAIFEATALGEPFTIATLAEGLSLSSSAVRSSLYGREGEIGAIARINRALNTLDREQQKAIVDTLVPFSYDNLGGVLKRLAALRPPTDHQIGRKEQLLNAVISFVADLHPPPALSISAGKPGTTLRRDLQPYEITRLIHAYLGRFEGNFEKTLTEFADAVGIREEIRVSEKKLARFLKGKDVHAVREHGAISKFVRQMKSCQKSIEKHNRTADDVPLRPDHILDIHENLSSIDWAIRIIKAGTPFEAVKIASLYCSTRPHTVRELARVATRYAEASGNKQDIASYNSLFIQTINSAVSLTDSNVFSLIEKAARSHGTHVGQDFNITPLLYACCQRGVSTEYAARFLSTLATNTSLLAEALIEEWGHLSRASSGGAHSTRVIGFARRSFARFAERTFGSVLTYQELEANAGRYGELCALTQTRRTEQNAQAQRTEHLINGFFQQYSLDAVIKKFCSHLIQSNANPSGAPYASLLEAASDAVFGAARRYNPEEYTKEGRPIATFNSFAVETIKWECLNESKRFARDLSRAPVRLDAQPDYDSDGTTYHNLIAASDPQLDLESEVQFEDLVQAIQALPPVARRIIELRFELGEDADSREEMSLRGIAQRLYEEGLTPAALSHERIRQIMTHSLFKLRAKAFSGSKEEWASYFSAIEQRELPNPLMLKVQHLSLNIMPGLTFDLKGSEMKRTLVFEVDRVYSEDKRMLDVYVRSRDAETLEESGLYVVTLQRGKLVSCERVE